MSRHERETEYVPLDVTIYAVTEKALKISLEGYEEDDSVWVPRSQCRYDGEPKKNTDVTIEVADWIAEREGLI